MGAVRNNLLKLIQTLNENGSSWALQYVRLDFIEKMELDAEQDLFFKRHLQKMDALACKAIKNIEDYAALVQIAESYSECFIYSKLKALLFVRPVPESANSRSPDFEVMFRDSTAYFEVKALNMVGGFLKHKQIMLSGMTSTIEAEESSKHGGIGFGEQEIAPYRSENRPYNPRSTRLVIEELILKVQQNIKEDQFKIGPTILLIDLCGHLPILSEPVKSLQERFYDYDSKAHISGEFWHVAFGSIGSNISTFPEFAGGPNSDGTLQKSGILNENTFIKGLVFHYQDRFYSLCKLQRGNEIPISLVKYISSANGFRR